MNNKRHLFYFNKAADYKSDLTDDVDGWVQFDLMCLKKYIVCVCVAAREADSL